MSLVARCRRFLADRQGVSAVEVAILSPVMVAAMMGLGDLCYQAYVQSIVQGAVLKAGRDSGIQGGAQRAGELDERVMTDVRRVAKNATYTSTRRSYASFGRIKPEDFTDRNANGRRDAGECFEDVNGNRQWDADPGLNGQGGANDTVVYTINVTYPRLFPVTRLFGWTGTQEVVGRTTLKNQPFATQVQPVVTSICT